MTASRDAHAWGWRRWKPRHFGRDWENYLRPRTPLPPDLAAVAGVEPPELDPADAPMTARRWLALYL